MCKIFYLMIGKNATETSEKLRLAFGEETMSSIQTFDRFSKFRSGVSPINLSTSIHEQIR